MRIRKDVSLHDPIGTDKEGSEITLIDILGTVTARRKSSLAVSGSSMVGMSGRSGKLQWSCISRSYVSRIEKRALMKAKR